MIVDYHMKSNLILSRSSGQYYREIREYCPFFLEKGAKMFKDEFQSVCSAGVSKYNFMKTNPAGYMVSSMVAGMFISFGSFVAFVLGSLISAGDAASWTKAAQAFAFAAALSLVVMAGAELFTGCTADGGPRLCAAPVLYGPVLAGGTGISGARGPERHVGTVLCLLQQWVYGLSGGGHNIRR